MICKQSELKRNHGCLIQWIVSLTPDMTTEIILTPDLMVSYTGILNNYSKYSQKYLAALFGPCTPIPLLCVVVRAAKHLYK